MLRRNTKQKTIILNAVYELANHPTAQEVYEYINKTNPTIGKSTVYRVLDFLAGEGMLKKIEMPNGASRFDHTLIKHYHVLCIKCNNIYDVKIDDIPNLCDNITNLNGMKFVGFDITFRGICKKCQETNS